MTELAKLDIRIGPPALQQPVTIPGKRTMPSKSILDPSFKYSSGCATFRDTNKRISHEDVLQCLALLRDADMRLRQVGYSGDTTVRLDILAVMGTLEKL